MLSPQEELGIGLVVLVLCGLAAFLLAAVVLMLGSSCDVAGGSETYTQVCQRSYDQQGQFKTNCVGETPK